ncbi:MAG: 16S rRNA processing protein RimM [Atopobiaceae bacterium]|nr:16S rRNA processing protein RimM [Atopobiaceae bacterium]
MRERYRAIARVEKTHGKRGEVVTGPVHGLPPVLDDGMDVVPVPPALKGARALTVTSVSDGPTGQLVAFRGVTGIGAASELVGKTLLLREADLPSSFAMHDVVSLVGREVTDEALGPLGTIEEVMQGIANDVWVVTGDHGEVLVPVVDEFVRSLPAEGPISVCLPDGLVGGD